MAEQNIEKLNERLEKAATAYKEVKAQLDAANTRIAELEASNPAQPTVDVAELQSLRQKVKDYEDELAINGNSSEEIAKLNERLNKAKEIFTEQKTKIADLTNDVNEIAANKEQLASTLASAIAELNSVKEDAENYKAMVNKLSGIIQAVKAAVNE